MKTSKFVDSAAIFRFKFLFILPFLIYVLLVNGALPEIYSPTLGQAVWMVGFSQSMASGHPISVFAHDIGIPEPAAIAFGLPMALIAALALKLGASPPTAYSIACLVWFVVAFHGAYALGRWLGATIAIAAAGAAVWLSFPIVWQHSGYSALSLGIALLPAYYYSALRIIESKKFLLKDILLFLFMVIVASFMDGYSFIMFASACLASIAKKLLFDRDFSGSFRSTILICFGFFVSFYLYNSFSPSADFKYDIDFFRGWGTDAAFLLVPTRGLLWLPDLIGISDERNFADYFGDESVHWTTFAIVPITVAFLLLLIPYGDRRLKVYVLAVGIIALYLSLGPSFKFNSIRPEGLSPVMPAEYALGPTGTAILWENIPGLYSMRAVYRWMALAFLGFWAVGMIAMSDRRMPRWMSAGILITLAAINMPNFERLLQNYKTNHSAFLQLSGDIERELGAYFQQGETVTFLPAGNDFLANFLAPRLGVRTYNIGGDKNYQLASASWPPEVRAASQARDPAAFAGGVLEALSGETDMVAVPYINLLSAAHRWPYPRDRYDAMQPNVQALRSAGAFDIVETEYFALVRFNEETRAMSTQERRERYPDLYYALACAEIFCAGRSAASISRFHQVGHMVDGRWSTDGRPGYLMYGPYLPIPRGAYRVEIRGVFNDTTDLYVDAAAGRGASQLFARTYTGVPIADSLVFEFEADEDYPDIEIRMRVGAATDVSLSGYSIEKVE